MPAWLSVTLGVVIVWALIVMASVTLAELTRRHHRTARRYAIRQGKRGALAAGRAARRHGQALLARACAGPVPAGRPGPGRPGPERTSSAGRRDPPSGRQTGDRGRHAFFQPAGSGSRPDRPGRQHAATSQSTTGGTTMAPNLTGRHTGPGFREHTFAECSPDLCREQRGALATASRIPPDRRARRTAARAGGTMPSAWGPVVAQAADFEPETDGDLLDWMGGEVTGIAAYAEALSSVRDPRRRGIGMDPKWPGRAARRRRRAGARRRDHVRRQPEVRRPLRACRGSSPPRAG